MYSYFSSERKSIKYNACLLFCTCRRCSNSCSNIGIHFIMWHHTLNPWRSTFADFRSGRTYRDHVHIHVQFCKRETRVGPEFVSGMDWMVNIDLCVHFVDVFIWRPRCNCFLVPFIITWLNIVLFFFFLF